jgi:DNA-binding transcriptional regulator of glucitol operon
MGRKSDASSKLKNKPQEPGDGQVGEWPRYARFCKRLERAIANGEEHAPRAQQGPTRW